MVIDDIFWRVVSWVWVNQALHSVTLPFFAFQLLHCQKSNNQAYLLAHACSVFSDVINKIQSSLSELYCAGGLRLACGRSGDRTWVGPRQHFWKFLSGFGPLPSIIFVETPPQSYRFRIEFVSLENIFCFPFTGSTHIIFLFRVLTNPKSP